MTLPQRTNADCIPEFMNSFSSPYALPQRTNADCILISGNRAGIVVRLCLSAQMRIASLCCEALSASTSLCLSAQMRIASTPRKPMIISYMLCLSAQMRIASRNHTGNQSKGALCLSAQMRIASAILHKNAISFFAACAVSR